MRRLFALPAALLLLFLSAAPALAVEASEAPGAHPLAPGTPFPDVSLTGEVSPQAAAYLGVTAGKRATPINAVKAEVLVVEIFSMYCPFCQREAPNVNALHSLIDKRGLGNRIKIVGIGAGNSEAEVNLFRQKYAVPFPLFSDADFDVHNQVGQVGTPFFYILKKKPQGGFVVLQASLGAFGAPADFLGAIIRAAGL
ncbi:alkyl hydroperoxide reductase/ Thiol specific antioxidant/ Mal allergen [Solidesulfovibrio fructosivorans JJ]]|uniref:Alkyl hydroperoxide reductase/ Thiol specific antioxidant/ Mal allergen n=1 Tax=Solidesulfovibrio fructosivorans JJ] TaxID=596151 RepID=E1JSA9_SOLFR|nr:TlpA disulfide reductase family protein [Solidesulfovibrio fructosivorans]EFL52878.1 alkyl hydroperoxide reductase/ Thiol specific antioxidant/ Mal allergen [Solidesulfovibrio fructosivorans JJ]]